MLTKVSEMDAGGAAATPGLPAATSAMSAMSADDAGRNREAILEVVKRKLENTNHSPVSYLAAKYHGAEDKEQYARALWQELPPMDSNPPVMGATCLASRWGR